MTSEDTAWALHAEKWHRVVDGQLLCGTCLPTDLQMHTQSEVLDDIAERRTTVCGPCDRVHAGGAPAPRKITDAVLDRLSPAQREIYERRLAQKAAAAKRRRAASKDSGKQRSRSVRTVSGGLPGLGKRK